MIFDHLSMDSRKLIEKSNDGVSDQRHHHMISSRIPKPRKGILKSYSDRLVDDSRSRRLLPLRESLPVNLSLDKSATNIFGTTVETRTRKQTRSLSRDRSLDQDSSRQPSQIPKLSVSWWETHSVAGALSVDGASSDADDNISVQSFGSNASWISRNWAGKCTKYVPHCEKRHLHACEGGEYLTPTQRKNRLIADLRRQIRNLQKLLDDKDRHIDHLRDRLSELEEILDRGGLLAENQRLKIQLRKVQEHVRQERVKLAQQYNQILNKIRQEAGIEQETDLLGDKWGSNYELVVLSPEAELEVAVKSEDYDSGIASDIADCHFSKIGRTFSAGQVCDASTITDPDRSNVDRGQLIAQLEKEIQSQQLESLHLRNRITELECSLARLNELESFMPHYKATVFAQPPAVFACENTYCQGRTNELIAQIEAYRSECLIWRTKTSELDLEVKKQQDRIREMELLVEDANRDKQDADLLYEEREHMVKEFSSLQQRCFELEMQTRLLPHTTSEMSTSQASATPTSPVRAGLFVPSPTHLTPLSLSPSSSRRSTGLFSPGFTPLSQDAIDTLQHQVANLQDVTEKQRSALEELNTRAEHAERQLDISREQLQSSNEHACRLKCDLSQANTELEVAGLTMERLRDNNIKQAKECKKLEEKIKRMEDSGMLVPLDMSDVQVTAEPMLKRRPGRYVVEMAGRVLQTDLKGEEIESAFNNLEVALERLSILERDSTNCQESLEYRLSEVMKDLLIKHELCCTLSSQLQNLQKEYEEFRVLKINQIDDCMVKIRELGAFASKLPLVEQDLCTANADITELRRQLRSERDECEQVLQEAMTNSMRSQTKTESYWQDKIEKLEQELDKTRRKLEKTQNELHDARLSMNLAKVDLEQRLQAQCNETERLQTIVYVEKKSTEMSTDFNVLEKAVQFRPNCVSVGTEILENDLKDEKADMIKLLQGELNTTRRQIEILHMKLYELEEARSHFEEYETHKKNLTSKLNIAENELERCKMDRFDDADANLSMSDLVERLKKEKEAAKLREKENLEKLENEFKLMQRELQSIVQRYENEKRDLRHKFNVIVEHNEKLTSRLEALGETVSVSDEASSAIESLSRPESEVDGCIIRDVEQMPLTDISGLEQKIHEISDELDDDLNSPFDLRSVENKRSTATLTQDKPMANLSADELTVAELNNASVGNSRKPLLNNVIELNPSENVTIPQNDYLGVFYTGNHIGAVGGGMSDSGISEAQAQDSPVHNIKSLMSGISSNAVGSQIPAALKTLRVLNDKLQFENKLLRTELQFVRDNLKSIKATIAQNKDDSSYIPNSTNTQQKAAKSNKSNVSLANEACSAMMLNSVEVSVNDTVEKLCQIIEKHNKFETELQQLGIETLTRGNVQDAKDNALCQWLEVDLQKEKKELENIHVWYERDKKIFKEKLKVMNKKQSELQQRNESLVAELERRQNEIEHLHDGYRGVCRELELYKQEDAMKTKEVNEEDRQVSRSEADLLNPKNVSNKKDMQLWKDKAGKIFKEAVSLEKQFRAVKYEKAEIDTDLHILRGELAVVRAHYETERDRLLAKIESISGEKWLDDSGVDYTRELLRNLEIKKQELNDLSSLYESETRRLKEELYALKLGSEKSEYVEELQKRFELRENYIEHLKSELQLARTVQVRKKRSVSATSRSSSDRTPTPSCQNNTNSGSLSDDERSLCRQISAVDQFELQQLRLELQSERTVLTCKVKDLQNKLRTMDSIVVERENYAKIVEREVKSVEDELKMHRSKHSEEIAELKEQTEKLETEKREILEEMSHVSQIGKVQAIEKLWKQELQSTKAKYDIELKTLVKDLQQERYQFDNNLRDLKQKCETVNTILAQKENCIRIVEKELKVAEDALKMQRSRFEMQINMLKEQLLTVTRNLGFENKFEASQEIEKRLELEKQNQELIDKLNAVNDELSKIKAKLQVLLADRANYNNTTTTTSGTDSDRSGNHLTNKESTTTSEDENDSIRSSSYESAKSEPIIIANLGTTPNDSKLQIILRERDVARDSVVRLQHELDVVKNAQFAEREQFTSEISHLKLVLQENQSTNSMELAKILDTAAQLQEKVDSLMIEMETKQRHQIEMYTLMFRRGQEAAFAEINEGVHIPTPLATPEFSSMTAQIEQELASRRSFSKARNLSDEEILLRFLRDAMYYYLLDRDPKDHLFAIMNILKFSETQREEVLKQRTFKPR